MILVKTEMGHQVLKDRSVRLTPRQRSAFILFDGRRTVAEVLQASQGQQDDVDTLVNLGLLLLNQATGDVRWHHLPLLGWGLGLAIHGVVTFLGLATDGLRRRMLDHELRVLQHAEGR